MFMAKKEREEFKMVEDEDGQWIQASP